MKLQRLFQPFQINQMTVKNRLAMTAMHLLYTEDGSVNQRTKDFYLARAKGGVGMIIAGGAIPSVKGMVAERKAKQQQEIAENLTARIAEQEDIEGL